MRNFKITDHESGGVVLQKANAEAAFCHQRAEENRRMAEQSGDPALRVRLKTSTRITKLSQHETDRGEFQECACVAVEIFPVLCQASATVEPGNRTFDDPALGQLYKPFRLIGSFDNFGFEIRPYFSERVAEDWPLISAVGKQLFEEWKLTEQRCQQCDATIAVLNPGRVDDGV